MVSVALPFTFTSMQEKWAPVFTQAQMQAPNDDGRFAVNATFTLQVTVTSTCSNDVAFGMYRGGGRSLVAQVPALAESMTMTVVDRI